MAVEMKSYPKELREQVLKEIKETGNMALVARTHGIAYGTVSSWIYSERKAPAKKHKQDLKALGARLKDAELENRILKELLKKTNQLWLTDAPSVPNS